MLPLAAQRLGLIFVPLRAPGVANGRSAVGGFRPFADLSKIPQKRLLASAGKVCKGSVDLPGCSLNQCASVAM
jgi:hypothetical protein